MTTLHAKEILIVDDDEDSRLLVEKILHYYSFKTSVVVDGETALMYCKKHCPDLILIDLTLPDMSGKEVARLLRQDERLKKIPFIAFSANPLIYDHDANFNEFILKPLHPDELMRVIRKHLDRT